MFNQRSDSHELLDILNLNDNELQQNLDEIESLNQWFGSKKVIINAINTIYKKYIESFKDKKIQIADLGCGNGDLLRAIDVWSKKEKITLELTGVDVNSSITQYAIQKSMLHTAIQYKTIDILSSEFNKNRYDIICMNSVCHHFNDESIIRILKQLVSQATMAIVINDLQRHWLSYFSIKWLLKIFNFSYLAKNDGPLSVLRAFQKRDWINLFKQANINNYQIRWSWAFRWEIIIWCKH